MASSIQQKRSSGYTPLFVQKKDRKLQLPALNIPSSSLTDGTNIPPPAESPIKATSEDSGASAVAQHSTSNHDQATPQTPLALESPAPLRSHPTSNHSLSRQFKLDEQDSPGSAHTGGDVVRVTQTTSVTTQPHPHQGNGHAYAPAPSMTTNSSYKQGVASDGSPAPSSRQAPKRHQTSDSLSPPPKRPMSVRKFLGLRAISAAFGGKSSAEKEREKAEGAGSGTYHTRNRSSDKLSLFSRRPESRQSNSQPTLRKRRSSLMLLARRGSSFFGLSVDEEPELEGQGQQGANRESHEQTMQQSPPRKITPPPTLPAWGTLRGNRGLHEPEGGFMDGDEMFRDIK